MRPDYNAEGDGLLDTLLLQHHISLKMVCDCAASRYNELKKMEHIFDLKTEEDVRRFLMLPRILDPHGADDLISYFREEKRASWIAGVAEPDLYDGTENYALLLITAFIYNTAFFAMAWNWCALVREEVRLRMVREQEQRERFTVVRGSPRSKGIDLGKPNMQEAASGTRVSVSGHWGREKLLEENIDGELWRLVREGGVEFVFKFAEYADKPPYYILVQESGHQEPIRLDRIKTNRPGKELSITSGKISWNDLNANISIFREDIGDA